MKIATEAMLLAYFAAFASAGFGQTKPAESVKANICELAKTPEKFNGKLVQVRASAVAGMEISGLEDTTCSAWVHLAYGSDTYMTAHAGEQYAFVPTVRDPHRPYRLITDPKSKFDPKHPSRLKWKSVEPPLRVIRREDEVLRVFVGYLARKFRESDGHYCFDCPLYKVTATVIGRFDHSDSPLIAFRPKRHGKVSYESAGFGHLNAALSQLVLQSVSDVVAEPIDPSVYLGKRK